MVSTSGAESVCANPTIAAAIYAIHESIVSEHHPHFDRMDVCMWVGMYVCMYVCRYVGMYVGM